MASPVSGWAIFAETKKRAKWAVFRPFKDGEYFSHPGFEVFASEALSAKEL
jgi:hypothetical protein